MNGNTKNHSNAKILIVSLLIAISVLSAGLWSEGIWKSYTGWVAIVSLTVGSLTIFVQKMWTNFLERWNNFFDPPDGEKFE